MTQSPQERLYAIVEQGLCTGCGLCQSVAGKEKIKVVKTVTNYERPIVVGDLTHADVDKIYDTCPGTRVDGLPEKLAGEGAKTDNVWGVWRDIPRAWAGDDTIRHEGATAGVLTALSQFALETGRVDFVAHVKPGGEDPAFGQVQVSFTLDEVLDGVGSRYGPAAPLREIHAALDLDRPFMFVGKPCDVAALRNLARHDRRVEKNVKYMLTMVCGGYTTPVALDAFYRRMGTRREDVTKLRYRGLGCPGPTTVEAGKVSKSVHYLDFWGDDESMWQLPFRCKICPDGIGEAADIAAADTWIGGSPTREGSEDDPGVNALLVRSMAGQELYDAAVAGGAIVTDYSVTPDDMSMFQPHQMRKKYAAFARHQGLEDVGRIVPKTTRLRIQELSRDNSDATNQQQRSGTVARIKAGKADEPTPVPANKTE